MWHVFRSRFKWCFPPRIHHESTTIYHAKNHALRAQFLKKPLQKTRNPPAEKNPRSKNLKPANKQFTLIDHLGRKMIVQQKKQLFMPHNLLLPLVTVNRLKHVEG